LITPQAALKLIRQLVATNVSREITGLAAWSAFSTP
jgi:hypothetical protein